ncbi:hypothetical protein N7462_009429 [Penicillium macrosclerotiorum]|uniref:uncharacterized protein n=1 Tax=Penicillium macrosclerotiorum TaxID=303699 RepID=UPI0025470CD6|nr:uncharacterized protein N7462_009429 [Penicillium macrosclerotiorum]KAJ5673990.1 hypothetical protein N7462_009429 [Penicillium macrosclerotiorum]
MPPRAGIQPLPSDVIAKLKSSTSITHLNGVIVELVKNALDANAHTVHVSVDFKRGSCIVEDDGDGIRPAEFESTGGLGKAHYTSNFQNRGAYGQRGLFLASLASLSLLTVTARHRQYPTTNAIVFHHSKPVARLIPAPAHRSLRFGEHGTCVTVNDLFGNMPVRVKSRALALQKFDEMEREWVQLRYSLVSLMLSNIQLSKLVIFDMERGKKITIRPDLLTQSESSESPSGEMNLRRIGSILAPSAMIDSRNMDSWRIMSATSPDLIIRAALCTMPSPSKKCQFISLGKDPVFPRNSSNVLFSEVNRLVSMSDFGNARAASDAATLPCPLPLHGESDAPNSVGSRTWAKPINKWPMFYIRIDTSSLGPVDCIEPSTESEESLRHILDVLGAMILEFLKQQNLRPRAIKRQRKISKRSQESSSLSRAGSCQSSSSLTQFGQATSTEEIFNGRHKLPTFGRSQSVNSGVHFNNWSRVKAANASESPAPLTGLGSGNIAPNNRNLPAEANILAPPGQPRTHFQLRKYDGNHPTPSDEIHKDSAASCNVTKQVQTCDDPSSQSSADSLISWIDPHTGKSHLINSRTGLIVGPKSLPDGPRSTSFFTTLQKLGLSDKPQPSSTSKLWVDNLIEAWDNPIFARSELQIPRLATGADTSQTKLCSHDCFGEIGSLGTSQFAKFKGRLRRHDLAMATVIAQVDQKFILTRFGSSQYGTSGDNDSGAFLVLIDQHAADERCRVEDLFANMFISTSASRHPEVQTVEIDCISFRISSTEASLFQKYKNFFKHWGIHYGIDKRSEEGVGMIVSVYALPILIAERCRLEPTLVVDLLRREIWTAEEEDSRPGRSLDSREDFLRNYHYGYGESSLHESMDSIAHPWIHKMNGCPQGILDMLNSRACRGAIMFNDSLNNDECRALVTRLSRCAFPFQCAHGRPSMIPILDLRSQAGRDSLAFVDGDLPTNDDEHGNNQLRFLDAFQAQYES